MLELVGTVGGDSLYRGGEMQIRDRICKRNKSVTRRRYLKVSGIKNKLKIKSVQDKIGVFMTAIMSREKREGRVDERKTRNS